MIIGSRHKVLHYRAAHARILHRNVITISRYQKAKNVTTLVRGVIEMNLVWKTAETDHPVHELAYLLGTPFT